MSSGYPSNNFSYGETNDIPICETFHQSPHGEFRTSFYNPFEVKTRKRTKKSQFKVLERTFLENPKPNSTLRKQLAQELGMTPRGVQVWFQNRRAKAKNQRLMETRSERHSVILESQMHSTESSNININNPLIIEPTRFSAHGIDYESTTRQDFNSSHSSIGLDKPLQPIDHTRDSILFSAFDLNTAYFTTQENSKNMQIVHFSNTQKDVIKKPRQKQSPEALKIASTPEQYEMMMHQHQARREQQKTPDQQRKRSLESQLYCSQESYTQMGDTDNRSQEFRGRANSLPGQKTNCNQYCPISSRKATTYSNIFSPVSGIITNSVTIPLTPITAASVPEQIHNYAGSYNSSIENGLHTPSEIRDNHRPGIQLPMVVNSTRRNSCPPEFLAAFVGMNYLDDEKPPLATIVEDEVNVGYQQVVNLNGNTSSVDGYQSRLNHTISVSQYQSTAPSASTRYFQHLEPCSSMPITSEPGQERLKTRRLSEPRLNKLDSPIDEQSQLHGSISSNTEKLLYRGHNIDSAMWQNEKNL